MKKKLTKLEYIITNTVKIPDMSDIDYVYKRYASYEKAKDYLYERAKEHNLYLRDRHDVMVIRNIYIGCYIDLPFNLGRTTLHKAEITYESTEKIFALFIDNDDTDDIGLAEDTNSYSGDDIEKEINRYSAVLEDSEWVLIKRPNDED